MSSYLKINTIVDTSGFEKMFKNNLKLWSEGLIKAYTASGMAILRDIGERFEGEGLPPSRWTPLAEVTIKRRRAGKGKKHKDPKILQDTGTLKKSFMTGAEGNVFDVSHTHVTVGSKIPYAGIHQFGGMAGKNKKVKIPARPMVYKPEKVPELKAEIELIFGNVMMMYIARTD